MPEPRTLPLLLASVEDVTPHMRRIQLTGPSLEAFEYFAGQDLALPVVRDDGSVVRRRYTIRRYDPERRLIDLDFVMHGDGPGIRWAQAARPGLAIEAIGPRGKIGLNPNAKSHLFAGDATAVPGSLAMMEALPAGVRANAYLMVGGPRERQSFAADATKTVTWHYESGMGGPDGLVAAVSAVGVVPDAGHAYLAGEVALVSALNATLLARGWTADQISAKAYWNRGRANADRGEPEVKA
ncbi:MAG TPA: siderophore-interacting protein [Candidatus Dormibacteraeota bacterium]|nr:siderophore-interacting protein [Candidatus Dormibacteraeota bacterium]